jgi:hypothetical protein
MRLDPVTDTATIDAADLSEEIRTMPPKIYRYNQMWADAHKTAQRLERTVSEVKAEEYLRLRQEESKVTEAHMKALIDVSKKVAAAYDAWLEAERDANTLKGVLESLRARKDSLVTLSANQRAEQK